MLFVFGAWSERLAVRGRRRSCFQETVFGLHVSLQVLLVCYNGFATRDAARIAFAFVLALLVVAEGFRMWVTYSADIASKGATAWLVLVFAALSWANLVRCRVEIGWPRILQFDVIRINRGKHIWLVHECLIVVVLP